MQISVDSANRGIAARSLESPFSHTDYGGFNSSSVGDSVASHLKLCLYHSRVAGVTFVRYCRSRMNCSPLWTLMQIVWSPQSLRDLLALRDYIAKDSEQYADLTIARIFSTVERLLSECL
jgi:hypothetical protein